VNSDQGRPGEDDHRVLRFRPRHGAPTAQRPARRDQATSEPPIEHLGKYEGGDRDDDYRHRMLTNLAALVITLLLAAAGAWLAIKIAEMRKSQDCFLSGRRNCTPIAIERQMP